MIVIVTQERKAVKCENEFSETNKRFGARLFVSAFVKKVIGVPGVLQGWGSLCITRLYIRSEDEFVFAWKIEIVKGFERMVVVSLIYIMSDLTKGDTIWSKYCEISSVGQL